MKRTQICWLTAVLFGCTGNVSDLGGVYPDPPPPIPDGGVELPPERGACEPGVHIPESQLLRINRDAYVSAVETVFGERAVDAVRDAAEGLPEVSSGTFSTQTSVASDALVTAYAAVATDLAFAVAEDAASLRELNECLSALGANAARTDACIVSVCDEVGRALIRRPLTDEDRARFLDGYDLGRTESTAEGVATMLMTMLLDPEFLYFFEVRGEELPSGAVALTSHEIAARLARVLWDSVPDSALMAAADAGLSGEALRTQVERMWADPKAEKAVERFFSEWFHLETLPFPSDALAPSGPAVLRDAIREEVQEFTNHVTFRTEGTFQDLFLSRETFVNAPDLANLYGLPEGTLGQATLPEGQRAGLLTRAGFLTTQSVPDSNVGHVIHRGVHLGELICSPLPPPTDVEFPDEDPANPNTNPDLGIRGRFALATAEPQCQACHTIIDGLGAPFGNYGAGGEWIEQERVVLGGMERFLEIDTNAVFTIDGEAFPISSGVETSTLIAESDAGPRCFVKLLSQNALGRNPGRDDSCLLDAAEDGLRGTDGRPGSIQEAIVQMILAPEFSLRSLPEDGGAP